MQVQLQGERAYYEKQAGQTATTLTVLAVFVGVVMGIGAVFGAMNTMYGLVASRTREIGTLRALGFSRLSIMAAFIIESALLALVAGLVGCLLALPVNFLSGATGGANFSQVAFAFRISGRLAGDRGHRGRLHGHLRRDAAVVPGGENADHCSAARCVGAITRLHKCTMECSLTGRVAFAAGHRS